MGRTIIEYVGLLDEPDYYAKIEAKREIARQAGLSLIVVEPRHILDLDQVLLQLRKDE